MLISIFNFGILNEKRKQLKFGKFALIIVEYLLDQFSPFVDGDGLALTKSLVTVC